MVDLKNGICCFGPAFFVSAAFIMSIVSSSYCNFVRLDDDNIRRLGQIEFDKIGFWCFEVEGSGSRFDYSNVDFDDQFRKARIFGTTGNSLGFCVWLFYLFASCFPCAGPVILLNGFFAFLACIFECFKWWIMKSTFFCDGEGLGCTMDTVGKVGISAACCWFVACLMTCAHGMERLKKSGGNGGGGEGYGYEDP